MKCPPLKHLKGRMHYDSRTVLRNIARVSISQIFNKFIMLAKFTFCLLWVTDLFHDQFLMIINFDKTMI